MKSEPFSNLKTVKQKVEFLLQQNPNLRDSDDSLFANIILKEQGESINDMTALDLLAKISNLRYSKISTIVRARQQIQNEIDSLKGVSFGKKKKASKIPLFKVNIREK